MKNTKAIFYLQEEKPMMKLWVF